MARSNFESLIVYQLSERLADEIWEMVGSWRDFARDTVGKQLVRAADSIGANIAEGNGRGNFQDNRRFVRIARGSLHEGAKKIELLTPLVDELAPRLNAYLKSIGPKPWRSDFGRLAVATGNGQLTTDN